MKEHKEGTYVIGNTWVKETEINGIGSYIELSIHKAMDIVHLQNADLLTA